MSFPQRTNSEGSASQPSSASGRRSPKRGLKQSSLFDLAGVVELGRLERHHRVLRDPKVDPEEGIRILRELAGKSPSTKIIIDTGIGKTIRRLSKSTSVDPGIAAEARTVYKKWRAAVERRVSLEERGPVDVLCDLPTTTRREKCKNLLKEALGSCSEVAEGLREDLASKIEKELFDQCKHLVRDEYRRRTRKLYFALRHEATLKDKLLLQRAPSIKRLVCEYK